MAHRRYFEPGVGWVETNDDPPYDEAEYSSMCKHEFVEAVDDDGNLIEPPFDICIQCGQVRH